MHYYIPILIAVMFFAGLLGGTINHFLAQEDDPKPKFIGRSFAVGIGASFLVPLFLNMISSNLIDSIKGGPNTSSDPSKILVFAGFCLVAAISSRAFIRTLSDRILAEAKAARKEAKQAKEDVLEVQSAIDPIIELETEGEPSAEQAENIAAPEVVDDEELKALEILAHGRFRFRTLRGIARDMKVDISECERVLSSLEAKDLIAKRVWKDGVRWYITQKGIHTPRDTYKGVARRTARLSIANGTVETFDDLKDIIDSLPTDSTMMSHVPPITEGADSGRVLEEQRNVRVRAVLYAACWGRTNDFQLAVGRAEDAKPEMYMIMNVSGLPSLISQSFRQLNAVRSAFKDFLEALPGSTTGWDFYDPPIPVEVEGSLLFNISHATDQKPGPPSLRTRIPRKNWEVHPITKIVFNP